jgi:hypothetical protein
VSVSTLNVRATKADTGMYLDKTRVNDVDHAIDCDRCFGDVGRHDHLPHMLGHRLKHLRTRKVREHRAIQLWSQWWSGASPSSAAHQAVPSRWAKPKGCVGFLA